LEETEVEEEKSISVCRKRLEYLSSYDPKDSVNLRKFNQTRLDRALVDHLLRNGNFETAKEFAKEKQIEDFVDIDIFTSSKMIIDDLNQHSCKSALGLKIKKLKKKNGALKINQS
jgi:macrophage erythroblast attacher